MHHLTLFQRCGLFTLFIFLIPIHLNTAEKKEIQTDIEAFETASRSYRDLLKGKADATEVFQSFIERFPKSPKVPEAFFFIGDALLENALENLRRDPIYLKDESQAKVPESAQKILKDAEKKYLHALKKASDDGLKCSATYRLGECAYNQKDWKKALGYFKTIIHSWPNSYLAPESLLGITYCYLALGNYDEADKTMTQLTQGFPQYLEDKSVTYTQGLLFLHKKEYEQAEKDLSSIESPEAKFYLAKAYMGLKKPLLAATIFDRLMKEYPTTDLREASAFFLGDAFFLSKDYDGAIVKYEELLRKSPFSKFKVAALYRIACSRFQKKEYGQARLTFGSILSQFPGDFFTSLSQYLIGESYLSLNQMKEALFSYSKTTTQFKGAPIEPMAIYRLCWSQHEVGEYHQSIQTADKFLVNFSTHPLLKNVYLIKGNSLTRLKKYPEAISSYQKILDMAPASDITEQSLFMMLKIQYDQKDFKAILTSYQFLLSQLAPSKSKWRSFSYLIVADSYLSVNQIAEAEEVYKMVLKIYPDDLAACYAVDGLAWCYQLSGRSIEALESREKLKEIARVEISTLTFMAVNDLGIADSYYSQKNYTDAYQFYDKFVQEHPDAPPVPIALYRSGLSLYHSRYYSQAIEIWTRLSEQYPNSEEAQWASYQMADTIFRGGKYEEAASLYRTIVERYPKSPNLSLAYLRLAQAAYQLKESEKALNQVQQLLLTFPKSPETTDAFELAEALFDANPNQDFQEFFKTIIQADPYAPTAGESQFRLARRLYENKNYAASSQEFQRFSVSYTNHTSLPKAQLLLGESYFNLGKFDEAAPAYERFVNNYSTEQEIPLVLLRLGSCYYNIKEYKKAAVAYERLVNEHRSSEYAKAAQFNLALSYKSAGDLEAAEVAYTKYANNFAAGEEVLAALWEMLMIQKEKKDYAEVLKTLSKIQAEAPQGSEISLEISYRKGETYEAMGDIANAQKIWEEMISAKPYSNPFRLQALVRLAEMYEKGAELKKAIDIYDDLARNASSPDVSRAAQEKMASLKKMAISPDQSSPAITSSEKRKSKE